MTAPDTNLPPDANAAPAAPAAAAASPKKGKRLQAKPTQPPKRDERGFELDQWGLPIVGPVRIAALAELGKLDPNDDPAAWGAAEEVNNG